MHLGLNELIKSLMIQWQELTKYGCDIKQWAAESSKLVGLYKTEKTRPKKEIYIYIYINIGSQQQFGIWLWSVCFRYIWPQLQPQSMPLSIIREQRLPFKPIFLFNSNLFLHWALKIKYLSICHFSCSSITSFTLLFSTEIPEILFWYVILFPTVAENMCTGTLQKSLLWFIIIIIQACLDMHTTNDIQGKWRNVRT